MSRTDPSSSDGLATSLSEHEESSRDTASDPFRTPFDNDNDEEDEEEDEWWDDEGSPIMPLQSSKATPRMTQWPATAGQWTASTSKATKIHIRKPPKPSKRYSVYKPTRDKSRHRQRKQNAAAGIKIITDFSQHHGPRPVQKPSIPSEAPLNPQPGCFVDLAALQALDKEAPNGNIGFWKSVKGRMPNKDNPTSAVDAAGTEGAHNAPQELGTVAPSLGRIGSRRGQGLRPTPIKLEADLSPNDRPIVIGISIPSARLAEHVISPQSATSETTVIQSANTLSPDDAVPQTPTIIITPSQTPHAWLRSVGNTAAAERRPRATSSVYSRATTYSSRDQAASAAPPLPTMPVSTLREIREGNHKERKIGRLSSNTVFSEDLEDRKSRVLSSYTVFEEDESPILARKSRGLSVSEANSGIKHTSIVAGPDQRRSTGWWNHILSPFLTRSNTVASPRSATQEHPALPKIPSAAIKAQGATWDIFNWEKTFSPVTPVTSTTIASDVWWDKRNTMTGSVKGKDRRDSVASPEAEEGTLPFMIAAGDLHSPSGQEWYGELSHADKTVNGNDTTTESTLRPNHSQNNTFVQESNTFVQESLSIPSVPVIRPPAPIVCNQLNPQSCRANLSIPTTTRHPRPINNAHQTQSRSIANMGSSEGTVLQEEPQPPPYSPPRAQHPRYHAVFPPGHRNNQGEPLSPGPLSPSLQQAMTSGGGIPLTDIPLADAPPTPAPRRLINLNSGYPGLPDRPVAIPAPGAVDRLASKKAREAEAKRQRYEKEDFVAHKAGGLWRGRGCIPDGGCYGRRGAEGRKRRRWYCCGLTTALLLMITLIVVLVTVLHRNSPTVVVEPTQWLNLTGFPPIFTGLSTVALPDNTVQNTGCVKPATVWSCYLPKDLQQGGDPTLFNRPNFRLQIQWDNSSAANATFANVMSGVHQQKRSLTGNPVSAGHFIRSLILRASEAVTFVPTPAPPSEAEQAFLGNSTDGIVSNKKAGEPTPFYVSFLSTSIPVQVQKRELTDGFPNITAEINTVFPPEVKSDGTAAAANLLPFPLQQPLRLYDRGLDSEHYGFYTYFNRSIFLETVEPQDNSSTGQPTNHDDENGGVKESDANFRCTWGETRFLVQMWTRKGNSSSLNKSTTSSPENSGTPSPNQTANNFDRPGSFPYPITITLDRHGGNLDRKSLYCYGLDKAKKPVPRTAVVVLERRAFGGLTFNPAPGFFEGTGTKASDPSLGGFDGGTGGCSCQWQNWKLKA